MRSRLPTAVLVLAMLAPARSASAEECTEFRVPDDTNAAAAKEAERADAGVNAASNKLKPNDPKVPSDPEAALTELNMALSLPTQRCNPKVLVQVAAVQEAKNNSAAAWDIYHLVESIR